MSIFDPVTKTLLRRRAPPLEKRQRRVKPQADVAAWISGRSDGPDKNPVAYRCARMIAEAAAAIPMIVEGDEAAAEAVLRLLRRPNLGQSGVAFLDALLMRLLAEGEVFIERVGEADNGPSQLYLLSGQNMHIVNDAQGWPLYYDYQSGGKRARHHANQQPCAIIHLRLSDHEAGKNNAPLQVATLAIAIHNAANHWNKALFENAARPSGALVYRGQDGNARLTDAQFERLKQELQDNFQGAENAGRPLLLEGGLDWARISMSPQDMDFIAAKHSAARDIALAFGVPPMLLGIPGDNSYANYAEANRAFWRQTIVPLMTRILDALGCSLLDGTARLLPDLDHVPALAEERRALWQRIDKASFLSADEKRALVGFAPLEKASDVQ